MLQESEINFKREYENIGIKIIDMRMENNKYAFDLKKSANELIEEKKFLLEMKSHIENKIEEYFNKSKEINKNTIDNFEVIKGEYFNIKNKFIELSEFIKDVRFRKNLGVDISKKDVKKIVRNLTNEKKNKNIKNNNNNKDNNIYDNINDFDNDNDNNNNINELNGLDNNDGKVWDENDNNNNNKVTSLVREYIKGNKKGDKGIKQIISKSNNINNNNNKNKDKDKEKEKDNNIYNLEENFVENKDNTNININEKEHIKKIANNLDIDIDLEINHYKVNHNQNHNQNQNETQSENIDSSKEYKNKNNNNNNINNYNLDENETYISDLIKESPSKQFLKNKNFKENNLPYQNNQTNLIKLENKQINKSNKKQNLKLQVIAREKNININIDTENKNDNTYNNYNTILTENFLNENIGNQTLQLNHVEANNNIIFPNDFEKPKKNQKFIQLNKQKNPLSIGNIGFNEINRNFSGKNLMPKIRKKSSTYLLSFENK
jgi:hypothetical protein